MNPPHSPLNHLSQWHCCHLPLSSLAACPIEWNTQDKQCLGKWGRPKGEGPGAHLPGKIAGEGPAEEESWLWMGWGGWLEDTEESPQVLHTGNQSCPWLFITRALVVWTCSLLLEGQVESKHLVRGDKTHDRIYNLWMAFEVIAQWGFMVQTLEDAIPIKGKPCSKTVDESSCLER